jgi:hypothetical protein
MVVGYITTCAIRTYHHDIIEILLEVALITIKTLSLDIYQHLFTLSKDILDIRDIATTHRVC